MKPSNRKSTFYFIVAVTAISATLVPLAYFFVDRPTAHWFYTHHFPHEWLFNVFTHIPEILIPLCIIGYIIYLVAWFLNRVTDEMNKILLICHSIVITDFIKNQLKFIFGRYWPLTWKHHNLSLIPDKYYGFNFMHGNHLNNAFPSGHTALTFAAGTAIALTFPRLRWIMFACMLLVPVSLLILDYHFVADILAGASLGFIVGKLCVELGSSRN